VGRSRKAAELMTLAGALHGAGIQLELLTGPMTGIYNPAGMPKRGTSRSRPIP